MSALPLIIQMSTCSAFARASSTSIPRYRTVLSILVCPRRSCAAADCRLPKIGAALVRRRECVPNRCGSSPMSAIQCDRSDRAHDVPFPRTQMVRKTRMRTGSSILTSALLISSLFGALAKFRRATSHSSLGPTMCSSSSALLCLRVKTDRTRSQLSLSPNRHASIHFGRLRRTSSRCSFRAVAANVST